MTGRLSIVSTPIGCLDDITIRALRVLREADVILAEDTRHTRTLCTRHDIRTPLRSFHEHTGEKKITSIIDALGGGAHYALVSDAGTPLVSDPGAYLVSRAVTSGIVVESVPGPSAVLAALTVSGLPTERFTFEGFLPRAGKERRAALRRVEESTATVVFFESPHRVRATLRELEANVEPQRRVVVCRELTKLHEEVLRGTLSSLAAALSDSPKGEITVVIERRHDSPVERNLDIDALVAMWKAEGLTTKDMAERLRDEHGWKRTAAYQAVLAVLDEG